MRVRTKVWLESGGTPIFGGGRTELLRRIQDTGSINQAAKDLGMSYRRALGRITQMEEGLGYPLVERQTGGRNGGGSALTAEAQALLDKFESLESEIEIMVRDRFGERLSLREPGKAEVAEV